MSDLTYAMYKGRRHPVLWGPGKTRFGHRVKLETLDGEGSFWVDSGKVTMGGGTEAPTDEDKTAETEPAYEPPPVPEYTPPEPPPAPAPEKVRPVVYHAHRKVNGHCALCGEKTPAEARSPWSPILCEGCGETLYGNPYENCDGGGCSHCGTEARR